MAYVERILKLESDIQETRNEVSEIYKAVVGDKIGNKGIVPRLQTLEDKVVEHEDIAKGIKYTKRILVFAASIVTLSLYDVVKDLYHYIHH